MTTPAAPIRAQSSPTVTLALRAALAQPDEAMAAWNRLRTTVDLDTCWDPDIIRLLPLVATNLTAADPDHTDLPRLRGVQRNLWVRNQHTAAAIDALVGALAAAGIDVRVSGGVSLARHFYPTLGHRPVDDTAVVVAPDALAAATQMAAANGWVGHRRPLPARLWWLAAARCGKGSGRPAPRRLTHTASNGAATAIVCVAPNPWAPHPWMPNPSTPDPSTPNPGLGASGTEVTPEVQLLATVAGGATAVVPRGAGWVADTVHLLRSGAVDPIRLARQVDRWQVGALVTARLATVTRTFDTLGGTDVIAALRECRTTRRARWATRNQRSTHD